MDVLWRSCPRYRVIKEKTTPVSRFTTPGKGKNRKKNPTKKEPIKNSANSEKRRKEGYEWLFDR
jgi:hypothetical protein